MPIYSFEVQGKGPFPVDMLRYDCCYPRDGESAAKILTPTDRTERYERRTLHLTSATGLRLGPTVGRWASFGWTVIAQYDEFGNPVPIF